MTSYRVMLVRQMSQVIYVEADDVAGAVYEAIERNDLAANASNNFDDSGDVEPYVVTDVATDRDVWTARVSGDGSWED
jgi:hypothetical protein